MVRDGPICAAQECDRFATDQIHNVQIDGVLFDVYVCEDCLEEMDEHENVETPVP